LSAEYPMAQPLAYSAKTGVGRDELWKQIRQSALGAVEERASTAL
jgi:hypothetical protein